MPQTNQRYYDFDALRSVLMTLGIVLHGANVFTPHDWAIQNNETSEFYQYLVDFIHLFRMPAFFVVSGFFLHFSYIRSGKNVFIQQRIPRIVVPFLVTAITLNTLQYYILNNSYAFLELGYWLKGSWSSHLWFLNCLINYFLISYLFMSAVPKALPIIGEFIDKVCFASKGAYLLLLPIISLCLLKIVYMMAIPDYEFYNFAIPESILYSVFFIFGIALGASQTIKADFISLKPIFFLLPAATFFYILSSFIPMEASQKALRELAKANITWATCSLIFYLFNKFLNKKSVFFFNLADSAYSIYLFHHILIIIFGLILIPVNLPAIFKFIILITSTFFVTKAIHKYVIRNISIMGILFNGKNYTKI